MMNANGYQQPEYIFRKRRQLMRKLASLTLLIVLSLFYPITTFSQNARPTCSGPFRLEVDESTEKIFFVFQGFFDCQYPARSTFTCRRWNDPAGNQRYELDVSFLNAMSTCRQSQEVKEAYKIIENNFRAQRIVKAEEQQRRFLEEQQRENQKIEAQNLSIAAQRQKELEQKALANKQRLFEDCLVDRFFEGFKGNSILLRSSPPTLVSKESFDGKTATFCYWTAKFSEEYELCFSGFKNRYKRMISVFPDSRNISIENGVPLLEHIFSKGHLEISYRVTDGSFTITDLKSVDFKLDGISTEENLVKLNNIFLDLEKAAQKTCKLNILSDADFKYELTKPHPF